MRLIRPLSHGGGRVCADERLRFRLMCRARSRW